MAPEYSAASIELRRAGVDVKLAKIDAVKNKALARKEGLKGYPLLKWYRGGTATDFYKYGREKEDLVAWVTKKAAPSTVNIQTIDEAQSFIQENAVAVIGFFKYQDSDEEKIFEQVGYSIEGVKLGVTNAESLFNHFKIDFEKAVVVFKHFEETEVRKVEDLSFKSLKQFILSNSSPTVLEYTEEQRKTIFHGSYTKHFFLWVNKKGENIEALEVFKSTAKEYKEQIMFVLVDVDQVDHKSLSNFFDIDVSDVPTFRLSSTSEQNILKYKPSSDELNQDNLKQFTNDFLAGELKPHLKSQEEQIGWNEKELKELVGSTFASVALNKARYVFVIFYSPTCGAPCEELINIMEELAKKMKTRHNIVIAKMNAVDNEIEMFKVGLSQV